MDKFSYAIGLGIGQNLLGMGAKSISVEDFAQAIKDVLEGNETAISHNEARDIVNTYFAELEAKMNAASIEQGNSFLEENKKKEGVITLPSGLQYEVITEGTGKIVINKRELENYFPSSILQFVVKQPLNTLDVLEKYDIRINLGGGGYKGQSEAARLGIARALVKINPDDKSALRAEGFMTRDPRVVERKNPGQPTARKRFQFSKR